MSARIATWLMNALAVPTVVLNLGAGIVGGVWLAIAGEWGLIGWGLLLAIGGPFILAIPMLVSLLFAGPSVAFLASGRSVLGFLFGGASLLYTIGLVATWCVLALASFLTTAKEHVFIPAALFAYASATAPLVYMASKEGDNDATLMTLFFSQAGLTVMLITLLIGRNLPVALASFMIVVVVGAVIQLLEAWRRIVSPGFKDLL